MWKQENEGVERKVVPLKIKCQGLCGGFEGVGIGILACSEGR